MRRRSIALSSFLISALFLSGCALKPAPQPAAEILSAATPPTSMNTTSQTPVQVVLKTTMGDITLELYPADAPKTVDNFLKLSREGFYNGTKFHRVIKDFMVQGGDPLSKDDSRKAFWGTGGPGYQFEDEINARKIVRGSLAMANAGPGTNGSQFFIVTAKATPWLDGKHTNFGAVVDGMEVVSAIEGVATGEADKPAKDIVVQEVVVENK